MVTIVLSTLEIKALPRMQEEHHIHKNIESVSEKSMFLFAGLHLNKDPIEVNKRPSMSL